MNLRPLGPEAGNGGFTPTHTHTHAVANGAKSLGIRVAGILTDFKETHRFAPRMSHLCPKVGAQTNPPTPPRGTRFQPLRPGRLLRMEAVAEVLGVSRATAYRLVESGELPHFRVANAIRVDPDELRAWMQRNAPVKPTR